MLLGGGESSDDGPDKNSNSDCSASVLKGTIAGGVIGGVMVIGLTIGGVWFYVRKNRRGRRSSDPEVEPTPFPLSIPSEGNPKSQREMKLSQGPDTSQHMTDSTSGNDGAAALTAAAMTQAVDVTMADLLLALNQQLRNERMGNERGWDSRESPPQYLESQQNQGDSMRLALV